MIKCSATRLSAHLQLGPHPGEKPGKAPRFQGVPLEIIALGIAQDQRTFCRAMEQSRVATVFHPFSCTVATTGPIDSPNKHALAKQLAENLEVHPVTDVHNHGCKSYNPTILA